MKKHPAEEKEGLIESWKASGKARRSFAQEHGISPQTFCKWVSKANNSSGFVELKAIEKLSEPAISREIILERGETKIRVPLGISQTEMETVTTLWRMLA